MSRINVSVAWDYFEKVNDADKKARCRVCGDLYSSRDQPGDSGGPLMTLSKRYVPCSYFVAGIVSWGSQCGRTLHGSYTNASYDKYQEWIVENVWPLQLKARSITLS